MYVTIRRGNRLGLALLGVLLIAGGVGALLVNRGVFGGRAAAEALYPAVASDWMGTHTWAWWIVAAVGALIAVLAVRWLLVQFRSDRISRLTIDTDRVPDDNAGRSTMLAGALSAALEQDAERIVGVRSASAAVIGDRESPELWLTVTLTEDADSGAVRTRLIETVVGNARIALDRPELPAYLTLDVSRKTAARSVR